jgi:5-histidylcysteine sulfoxide synthase
MIPICRDPKRFVAALNTDRILLGWRQGRKACTLQALSVLRWQYIPNRPCVLPSYRRFGSLSQLKETANIPIMTEPSTTTPADSMPLTGPRSVDWWTGKQPHECPGFNAMNCALYSLPQCTFEPATITRETLQDYFDNTWTLTEVLLSSLQGEEAFMRSPYHNLRHPMIFYYGHPAAVYVNKLRVAGLLTDPINSYFESIFETGVDEMSWDDLVSCYLASLIVSLFCLLLLLYQSKNKLAWPSVAAVKDYRKTVYDTVTRLIQALTPAQLASIDQKSPLWAFFLGFEHERIHLETSSVLINELPLKFVRFPEALPGYHSSWPARSEDISTPIAGQHFPVNDMIDVPKQTVSIGKPREFPTFGWDNEYGHREFVVPAFRASKFKISNGEYLEFVKDAGYARRELWTEIGWKWRAFRNVKWPTMWLRTGPQGHHQYDLRVIFDQGPMAWNWPVCVNFHEANAFANWKSFKTGKNYRVLTELEHRAIRDSKLKAENVTDDHAVRYGGADIVSKVRMVFMGFTIFFHRNFYVILGWI